MRSGLYIVTLNNEEPISVNANDPRCADTAICATKENCKWGKTTNFERRHKQYQRTFGKHNVNFKPVVCLKDINTADNVIRAALSEYRILGKTGRKNKWLQGIKPERVIELMLYHLDKAGIKYEPLL